MIGELYFHGTKAAGNSARKADVIPAGGRGLIAEALLFDDEPLAVMLQQFMDHTAPAIIGADPADRAPFIVKEQELRVVCSGHAPKMPLRMGRATAIISDMEKGAAKFIRCESKIWRGRARSARCRMSRKRNRIREEPL